MRLLLILILSGANTALAVAPRTPDRDFDDYGAISWKDEKARLDNFAIQLMNTDNHVGHILVVDAIGGCPGEAQARAIRAKRYMVEYRHVPWNRIIWKVEGYQIEISTVLLLAPPETMLPFPLRFTIPSGKSGPLTKNCQTRLRQIARSRWEVRQD